MKAASRPTTPQHIAGPAGAAPSSQAAHTNLARAAGSVGVAGSAHRLHMPPPGVVQRPGTGVLGPPPAARAQAPAHLHAQQPQPQPHPHQLQQFRQQQPQQQPQPKHQLSSQPPVQQRSAMAAPPATPRQPHVQPLQPETPRRQFLSPDRIASGCLGSTPGIQNLNGIHVTPLHLPAPPDCTGPSLTAPSLPGHMQHSFRGDTTPERNVNSAQALAPAKEREVQDTLQFTSLPFVMVEDDDD